MTCTSLVTFSSLRAVVVSWFGEPNQSGRPSVMVSDAGTDIKGTLQVTKKLSTLPFSPAFGNKSYYIITEVQERAQPGPKFILTVVLNHCVVRSDFHGSVDRMLLCSDEVSNEGATGLDDSRDSSRRQQNEWYSSTGTRTRMFRTSTTV